MCPHISTDAGKPPNGLHAQNSQGETNLKIKRLPANRTGKCKFQREILHKTAADSH